MLHVKWDRQVLHLPLPPLDTPLGKLRADLAAYTHLPVGSFKLVYKGAVMKEDGAALSAFKLGENATIALIGGHTLVPGSSTSASASAANKLKPASSSAPSHKALPQTEEGTIEAIRRELERVRETLVPDVDAFVRALVASTTKARAGGESEEGAAREGAGAGATPSSSSSKQTPLDHTRLSELLLQSLLRLDALHVPGVDWPEARVQRKAAVREVQGVLDRLDGAWAAR